MRASKSGFAPIAALFDSSLQTFAHSRMLCGAETLLQQSAYKAHAEIFSNCGTLTLAKASVAVPFVGAAVGALAVAQAIRVASMQETPQIIQLEFGSPGMAIVGVMNDAPTASLGSIAVRIA